LYHSFFDFGGKGELGELGPLKRFHLLYLVVVPNTLAETELFIIKSSKKLSWMFL